MYRKPGKQFPGPEIAIHAIAVTNTKSAAAWTATAGEVVAFLRQHKLDCWYDDGVPDWDTTAPTDSASECNPQ
jgi:hypothetical protein